MFQPQSQRTIIWEENRMKGKFYGLGVGPGDPELITMKAVGILEKADFIIAPETVAGKGSIAFDIVKGYVKNQNKVIFQVYPMTYDEKELERHWRSNVDEMLELLNQNKNVAFITLGDPMVYSTYIYIMRFIKEQQIEVETVPGITSFCAAASRLGISLSEGDESIAIIPAAYKCHNLDQILSTHDNIILMKPSRGLKETIDKLKEHNLANKAVMISKCGHKDEKIVHDIEGLQEQKIDYLSMLIAKKGGIS